METLVYVVLVVLMSEALAQDTVEKWESYKQDREANLTCGNKTWGKDNILYIIWTLNFKGKKLCKIQSNNKGHYNNTCLDDKSLINNTEGQPVLHIPHISYSDVGSYTCECPYYGGAVRYLYHVSVIAPPNVTSWIEMSGDRRLVVCRADRGSPAANISWAFTKNITNETVSESDGLISVESSVEVSAHEDPKNLSCIVSHPYWDEPQVFVPGNRTSQSTTGQNHSVVYATVAVSVVVCLALLIWGITKLHNLRNCQKSSSKTLSDEYVEEVEPYESYVQRVNSIYNSSRDLFA